MISDPRVAIGVCIASLATIAIAGAAQPLTLIAGLLLMLLLTILGTASPLGVSMTMIVVLPYFYRPLVIGSAEFAASEVLLLAALAGAGLRLAVGIFRSNSATAFVRTTTTRVTKSPLVWFLIVAVAAGLITTFMAFDPAQRSASLREVRWSLVEPLLMVSLLITIARQREAKLLVAMSLVGAGVLAAGHGLMDIVTGSGVVADNVRRLSGPLPHPNALALFLVRPLAVVAAIAVLAPQWRRYAVPPLVVTGMVLLATFSRGAMLAVVVVALILSLYTSRRTRLVMFSAVLAMGVFAFAVAGDRMRSALDGGSVSLRVDIWASALSMIRDSPVWGYGPDQFLYAYAPRYILPTAWNERFTSHAHNLVLDAWIRLGLIGAVAAGVALIVVFRAVYLKRNGRASRDWLSSAAVVALAAAMVHGLIDNAYFGHDLAMSSWLLAWLAFSPPGSSHSEAVHEP